MSQYETALITVLAELTDARPEHISSTRQFADQGVDSLIALRLCRVLSERLGFEVDPEWLFDHPSIQALSQFLAAHDSMPRASTLALSGNA